MGNRKSVSQERLDKRFSTELRKLLKELGWSTADLASRAGFRDRTIGRKLNKQRGLTREDVNKIAHAIAQGCEGGKSETYSTWERGTLEDVLRTLLQWSGRSPVDGPDRQLVFDRIRSELRSGNRECTVNVGWVRYPRVAIDPNNRVGRKGFAIELTNTLLHLMGIRPEYKAYGDWGELVPALERREIDLTMPVFAKTPERMFRVLFSEGIEGLDIRLNGILHGNCAHWLDARRTRPDGTREQEPRQARGRQPGPESERTANIAESRLLVAYSRGESAETLWRVMFPGAEAQAARHEPEEECREILENPVRRKSKNLDADTRLRDGDMIRCFMSDDWNCRQLVEKLKHDGLNAALLCDAPPDIWPRPQLAYAVHPEEVKWMGVISESLRIMENCGYIEQIKADYELHDYSRGCSSADLEAKAKRSTKSVTDVLKHSAKRKTPVAQRSASPSTRT